MPQALVTIMHDTHDNVWYSINLLLHASNKETESKYYFVNILKIE